MDSRICPGCGILKPDNEFNKIYKDPRKNILFPYCKECAYLIVFSKEF